MLLDELERRLRAFGAAVADAFRPGLPAADVALALEREGLRPHADLLTWWSWHDGASVDAPPATGVGVFFRPESALIGPWHVLPLADALRIRRALLDEHDQVGASELFPEALVPVLKFEGRPVLCAQCDTGALHIVDEFPEPPPLQFASLGDFVATVLRLFDEGLVQPRADEPRVASFDDARLDGDLRRLVSW